MCCTVATCAHEAMCRRNVGIDNYPVQVASRCDTREEVRFYTRTALDSLNRGFGQPKTQLRRAGCATEM